MIALKRKRKSRSIETNIVINLYEILETFQKKTIIFLKSKNQWNWRIPGHSPDGDESHCGDFLSQRDFVPLVLDNLREAEAEALKKKIQVLTSQNRSMTPSRMCSEEILRMTSSTQPLSAWKILILKISVKNKFYIRNVAHHSDQVVGGRLVANVFMPEYFEFLTPEISMSDGIFNFK